MGHDIVRRRIASRRENGEPNASPRSEDREGVVRATEVAMPDTVERHGDHASGSGFMLGLLTGTVLGAGLGMLLAPKSGSELRSQLGEHAASIGRVAGRELRRTGEAATGFADRVRSHATHEPAVPSRPSGEGESA